MKMNSVESKLKSIAKESFSDMAWVFDDWKAIDRKLSKVDLPAIICVMPVSGVLQFHRGRVKDKPNCYLVFLNKVAKDADGSENETVYTQMKKKAGEFVEAMNHSGMFEPIEGDVPYDVISESMSDILSGVGIALTVVESEYHCV